MLSAELQQIHVFAFTVQPDAIDSSTRYSGWLIRKTPDMATIFHQAFA
jgi:hypothetical protein